MISGQIEQVGAVDLKIGQTQKIGEKVEMFIRLLKGQKKIRKVAINK